jgi:hypothetical protein
MALIVNFEVKRMTSDKYAEVLRRLEAKGLGAPRGRIHHASFGTEQELRVVDIWDTAENFDAFGAELMPILGSLDIDPGEPAVSPVHHIIR